MIIGIGSDIVDIRRIENILRRHGRRFEERCFTSTEQKLARKRQETGLYYNTYAKRFAAKEACAKALGTGFAKGVFWRDVGVERHISGKPHFRLTGGALNRLLEITPDGMAAQVDLTLTDDYPWAQAVVLITAIPLQLVEKQ